MADTLTVNSRNFYENAKLKFAASLMIGAATMMLLGFTSVNGGESKANQLVADNINAAGWVEDCYNALAAGYGFASFVHILGFILILAAAIYISPFLCGSVNEKKILRTPQEMDSSFQPSAPPASSSHV